MQQISKVVITVCSTLNTLLVLQILSLRPNLLHPTRKCQNIPARSPDEDGGQLPGHGSASQLACPMSSHQSYSMPLHLPSCYSPECSSFFTQAQDKRAGLGCCSSKGEEWIPSSSFIQRHNPTGTNPSYHMLYFNHYLTPSNLNVSTCTLSL